MFLFESKKFKNILIISTKITEKIRWHYRILNRNNVQIKYLTMPLLADEIEKHKTDFSESFIRFKIKRDFLKICDCLVLGCTHYNNIKKLINNELKTNYSFKKEKF